MIYMGEKKNGLTKLLECVQLYRHDLWQHIDKASPASVPKEQWGATRIDVESEELRPPNVLVI